MSECRRNRRVWRHLIFRPTSVCEATRRWHREIERFEALLFRASNLSIPLVSSEVLGPEHGGARVQILGVGDAD